MFRVSTFDISLKHSGIADGKHGFHIHGGKVTSDCKFGTVRKALIG